MNGKQIAGIVAAAIGVGFLGFMVLRFTSGGPKAPEKSAYVETARSWDLEILKYERVRAAEWLEASTGNDRVESRHIRSAKNKVETLDMILEEKGIADPASLTMADVDEDRVWELRSAGSGGDR